MKSVNGHAGEVDGLDLQANGLLLEHKLAASSLEEASSAAYARIQIRGIRDWVVDHSSPPAIWLVTDAAWYRCVFSSFNKEHARQTEASKAAAMLCRAELSCSIGSHV